MSNQELPFQLLAWIKRDQEERRNHQLKMAVKNYKEDEEFMRLISFLIRDWKDLKVKEREFICSLARHREEGKNFTPAQRSAVTGMYLRYCA
jgi:hypothetical protein